MSVVTIIQQQLALLISKVNGIESNSKKIEELPAQTSLDLNSKIAVSRGGVSEHLDLQLLATALANNSYNRIISIEGDIDVTGTDITVPPITWEYDLVTYTKATDSIFSLDLCDTGLTRIDIIVVDNNGDVLHIEGNESDTIAIRPNIPVNSILVTQINVTDSVVGSPDNPIIGDSFVKKSFTQPFEFTGTGADQVIPLDPLGREEIRLTESGLTSVSGFDLSLIIGNSSAEQPFIGKTYIVHNLTGGNVTLKNSDGTADIIFLAREGADVVIPNLHQLEIKFGGGGMAEGLKSWSEGGAKRKQTLMFQVPTNGTTLTADEKNYCQSRFNSQSIFGTLGLVFGNGIPETGGVINLNDFSDRATPNITGDFISQVKKINFSYSRNVNESSANTNVYIRVLGETKYLTDTQLIAEYHLVSSTITATGENKINIPVLTHLNLSAFSNLKWCIRVANATAQTFNFMRLTIDTEEV